MRIRPTISHFWCVKARVHAKERKKKEEKEEKNKKEERRRKEQEKQRYGNFV